MTYFRIFNEALDYDKVINLKLRESDLKEIEASLGIPPREALQYSLKASTHTYVVVHNEEIVSVFGLNLLDTVMVAVPWFLSTDAFDEFTLCFAKTAKRIIKLWRKKYAFMYNLIDSRNTKSIKWLRWLGFTVKSENPIYLRDYDVPFYIFEMRSDMISD